MSIIVPGLSPASDFTTDPNITIQQLLQNNWSLTGAGGDSDLELYDVNLNPSGVKIGTGWYDESTFYQVHVRPFTRLTPRATIGSKPRMNYSDKRQVHIFAKGNPYGSGKDKLWKLEKEVERIVWSNNSSPGNGIQWMGIVSFTPLFEQDPKETVFHSLALLSLFYQKAVV